MLSFPQLSGKALVQYPVQKTVQPGSEAVTTRGGVRHGLFDPTARLTTWDLQYEGLTDAEARALAAFFEQTEGRYRSFAFADPLANLLGWSVDLTNTAWSTGPSVAVSGGINDPRGGHAAATVVNGSQTFSGIGQTQVAPAGCTYCVSAWLKGAAGTRCQFVAGGANGIVLAGNEWKRYEARAISSSSPVYFGVDVEPGAVVSMFGMQAEAQLSASAYMPSYGAGGLHTEARFDQDSLTLEAYGPDDYRTSIRIVSARQE